MASEGRFGSWRGACPDEGAVSLVGAGLGPASQKKKQKNTCLAMAPSVGFVYERSDRILQRGLSSVVCVRMRVGLRVLRGASGHGVVKIIEVPRQRFPPI